MAGSATPVATCVGPAFGPFHNPNLKADPYDPNKAVQELQAAGYSVSITPPAKIQAVGTPILGQAVAVKGYTAVAGMIVIVEQSSDQQTWTPVGAAAADTSGNYQVSVPGPPVFGSVWYRADFTGYAMNETIAGTSFSAEQAKAFIDAGETVGGGPAMVAQSYTDPVAISSVTNDAAVVLVIVIVLILIAVLAMRRRKPAVTKPK
jgi:putative copper export protein